MNSQELFERSQKVAPGGVHSPVRAFKSVGGSPLFFERAEGAYLYSVEGKRYIDFCQSFGPLILGHRDPDVAEAVSSIFHKAWTFGACEPYSLELAEWITHRIPWVEKLRFVNSGTEAVMSALRLARAATGRSKILKFEGCYHGHVDSMLVKAGSGLAGLAASDSAGVSQEQASNTLVCPLDDIESFNKLMDEFGSEIAMVALEPLPANFGLLQQKKEFIQAIAQKCKENGSLLLFDEVISGFRIKMGGMAEDLGVVPDLVTYGKVIGGGFPVGCYGGREDLMNMVAPSGPVYQAGTLSANPVGMVAGLATLQKVEKEKVIKSIDGRGREFEEDLNSFFEEKKLPIRLLRKGSLFWMYGGEADIPRSLGDIPEGHGEQFKKIFHKCLDHGLYLAPSGYEVGFLSHAHTPEILSEATQIIKKSVEEVYEV